MAPAVATDEPRDPSHTVLYKVVADHLETFLASLDADPDAKGLPAYVQREFYDYVQCGILAHGFLRLGCDTCQQELLLPCSCKRRGFCPRYKILFDNLNQLSYKFLLSRIFTVSASCVLYPLESRRNEE